MSRPFYSDVKGRKMCRSASSFSSSLFLFPRDFSGTTADTDTVNAPVEPSRPTDVPFGGYVAEQIFAENRFLAAVAPPGE